MSKRFTVDIEEACRVEGFLKILQTKIDEVCKFVDQNGDLLTRQCPEIADYRSQEYGIYIQRLRDIRIFILPIKGSYERLASRVIEKMNRIKGSGDPNM